MPQEPARAARTRTAGSRLAPAPAQRWRPRRRSTHTARSGFSRRRWTSPLSNKALLDVGISAYGARWGGNSSPGQSDAGLHPGPRTGRKHSRSLLSRRQPAVRRHIPRVDRLDHGEHLARAHLVRHRLAQLQGRLQRPLRQRQPAVELRQPAGSRVPVQQRRAEPVLGALRHVRQPVADQVRRVLRAGSVDA